MVCKFYLFIWFYRILIIIPTIKIVTCKLLLTVDCFKIFNIKHILLLFWLTSEPKQKNRIHRKFNTLYCTHHECSHKNILKNTYVYQNIHTCTTLCNNTNSCFMFCNFERKFESDNVKEGLEGVVFFGEAWRAKWFI